MAKNTKIKKELTKQERISKEIKRLSEIFKDMSNNTKKVVKSLIENASFMTITLEDLQKQINENGVISEYQNGQNQWGTKKSPEVEVHLSMTKNHTQIMKQLAELIPKEQPKESSDGFDDFVVNRDD